MKQMTKEHVSVSNPAEYLFPGLDHTTHEHPCHKWQQGYPIQCLCVSPSDSDWYMCIHAVAGSAKCAVLHCDPCDHHMLLQHYVYGVSSKGMRCILAANLISIIYDFYFINCHLSHCFELQPIVDTHIYFTDYHHKDGSWSCILVKAVPPHAVA